MFSLLDGAARERLSRIEMVKPQNAKEIQELIIKMAKSGQLRQKVTEQYLINLLDQTTKTESKIVVLEF